MKKPAKHQTGIVPVLLFVSALFIALGLGIGIRYILMGSGEGQSVAPVTIGGPFSLVDHTGASVTERTYQGKYPLIYFGYTYCPDVCPTSLGTMAEAMSKLSADKSAKIAPIMITIDPERDTKERLAEFVTAFHPNLVGLTGSVEEVTSVAKAYRVYFAKVKAEDPNVGYLVDHSALLYLMGPDGKFVRHFSHGTSAADMAVALEESVK